MSLTDRVRQFSVWWRRWKLDRAYGKVAEAELGKSHGFTPTVRKMELLEEHGHVEYDDGEKVWKWP